MKDQLIILPGFGGNAALWEHQSAHLKEIADPSIIAHATDNRAKKNADAILAQCQSSFHLVGHSLGGWIAQWVAIKAPHRVKTLTLLGTWPGDSSPALLKTFRKMLTQVNSGKRESMLDAIRPTTVHPDRLNDEILMQTLKTAQDRFPTADLINQIESEIHSESTTNYLDQITCPTLVIHGRQDAFFSLKIQQNICDKIPKANMTVVEDCGHMLPIEQPQAVTSLIRLQLQSHSETRV